MWRGPTESEENFRASLQERVGSVTFTQIDGGQQRTVLARQLREREAEIRAGKYALIYSYGSTVTETVSALIGSVQPIVFNIVATPVQTGFVESLEKPGRNLTGVTNGVPIAAQFDAIQTVSPIHRLAVIFNAREQNSNILLADIKKWAEQHGVPVRDFRVAPGTDALDKVLAQLSAADTQEDSLYIPADTYLASEGFKISAALGAKLRIYGGTETFVQRGALGAYAPEVKDTGIAAAAIAARILKGEKPADIPVVLPQPKLIIGRAAAQTHGITIPPGALVREVEQGALALDAVGSALLN